DKSEATNRFEQFGTVDENFALVSREVIDSKAHQVFERHTKPDRSGKVRGARFELVWQFVIGGLLERHGADHVATSLIRRHPVEEIFPAVQNPDSRRTEYFVSGKRVEIATQFPDVYAEMRNRLSAIN